MHKGMIQISQKNIAVSDGVLSYFYDVTPINSINVDDSQISTLVDLFMTKLIKINMPGQIMILPKEVNTPDIINNYNMAYKENGFKDFSKIANSMVNDIYQKLREAIRYRYKIVLVFTQDRDEIGTSLLQKVRLTKRFELDKDTMLYASDMEEFIFNELSSGLAINRYSPDSIEELMNYLAIPVENETEAFYYDPQGDYIKYNYNLEGEDFNDQREFKDMYTRTLIATKIPDILDRPISTLNRIQTLSYPVDTVIKFDVVASRQFVKDMQTKQQQIETSKKREAKALGYTSGQTKRELQVAKAGAHDEGDPYSKVKFQIMFRLRAHSVEMLQRRYKNFQTHMGADVDRPTSIMLSYEVGRQEALSDNLNPFAVGFYDYVHTTDVSYLAKFNLFGGISIGELVDGLVFSYTRPGHLPVLLEVQKILHGLTRRTAPITLICGESGGGKTQLANTIAMILLIICGMPTLIIDPKGDRKPLINLLPEGTAQNLIIGSDESQRGMFDPFNNYEGKDALEKAKNLLFQLARAVNQSFEINNMFVEKAYNDTVANVEAGIIKRVTLTEVSRELEKYDKTWSDNMLSFANDSQSYLFFADSNDKPRSFNLSYAFNLVTFEKTVNLEHFDINNLEHHLFSILVNQTETLLDQFMRKYPNMVKQAFIDEYNVFLASVKGSAVAENTGRIARSNFLLLTLIDQRYSTFKGFLQENASQVYIGSLKSTDEVKQVITDYALDDNQSIRNTLTDRTDQDGLTPDQKYRFVYIDYNGRKSIVRADLPSYFNQAMNTHLKKESEVTANENEKDIFDM